MRVKRKCVAVGVILLLPVVVLLLLSTQTQHVVMNSEDLQLEQQVVELQEKLHKAENLNRQHDEIMNGLLAGHNVPGNISIRKESTQQGHLVGLQVPGIHSYLPHLSGHPEFLRPAIVISKHRSGVSIVFGVPTVKREKESYLIKTLASLIAGLTKEESDNCLIVVFIAEPWDIQYAEQVITSIRENFDPALNSGLVDVIVPPAGFYPDLSNLTENFGDTKERVRWRTKQNLDYAFHMLYGRAKGTYYVQLEDDVVAKPGYLTVIKTFAQQQKDVWIMLEFSSLGFIGKMFKSSDVSIIVEFFLMFHSDKPIDWLIDHLLWVKVCSPEKDVKHCERMINAARHRYKPSLFQHIGMESSLKGKIQKLKDRDFGKAGLYRAHANPPAELSTSLSTYQNFLLSKAYAGDNFFWASNPSRGDTVDFKFKPAIHIDSYLFRSGHMDHPGDIFHNTSVEIQTTEKLSQSYIDSVVSKAELNNIEVVNATEGFIPVGHFNEMGVAEGEIPEEAGPIEILRLHIHEKSDAWVILSEIMIHENKNSTR